MGVLIQSTVVEVLEAQGGQGASLLGAGHPPDRTRGQGHEVYPRPARSLGLRPLGLTRQISTVMAPGTAGHLHTLLLAVLMEDEPHLDPVGKKVSLQRRDTAALKRHFTVHMPKAERSLHVTESIVKAGHL